MPFEPKESGGPEVEMGFRSLYGSELQSYAVELSKSKSKGINLIQGEASDIPFKDAYFDMVFTSGGLIHIATTSSPETMREIHRCARSYIFGLEYHSDSQEERPYRDQENLLRKGNFAGMYLKLFDDLCLIKEGRIKYQQNENIDAMFLLKKKIKT